MAQKKAAPVAIWKILQEHSDTDHRLTQNEILQYLNDDYDIQIERKAVGSSIAMLNELGIIIEKDPKEQGAYLYSRPFEDSELHLLIDSVLCSKYIKSANAKSLIKKLCDCTSKYFKSNHTYIHNVEEWPRTDNAALFYNIDIIDEAIRTKKQIHYNYNKYGEDKMLHKTSHQFVSPYYMILINQRYYLMAYSGYHGNMVFHKLDHISDISIVEDKKYVPLRSVKGYENGVDFKKFAPTLPYPFVDETRRVIFLADKSMIDQIIEWFGKDFSIMDIKDDPNRVKVSLHVSPMAMKYWALQYINHVEVIYPDSLRKEIKETLQNGVKKYK